VLADLSDLATKRYPGEAARWGGLFRDWEQAQRDLRGLEELIRWFATSIASLDMLSRKPAAAGREVRVRSALSFLRKNFQEPLTQSSLAERMGVPPRRFAVEFRKATGMGFNGYLRRLRCEEARHLLLSSGLGLATIAQDCGFNTTSYLVRSFKRVFGQTPEQYRQDRKKGNRSVKTI
jgi:AraC-like DNA-binding protein